MVGYGLAGDAYHITAPAEDGDGGFRAMEAAIGHAGIEPADIDYINAHGTSTPLGDEIELGAVERLLGQAAGKTAMSSTKSSIGHLLGAAGAVEAAFTVLALRDQIAPPTINLDNPVGGDRARPRAPQGQADEDRRRALQQLRLRRHQRLARVQEGAVSRGPTPGAAPVGPPGDARTRRRLIDGLSAPLATARRRAGRWSLVVGAAGLLRARARRAARATSTTVVLRQGAGLPEIAADLRRGGVDQLRHRLHRSPPSSPARRTR